MNILDAVAKKRHPLGSKHYRAALTEEAVRYIRAANKTGAKNVDLAEEFGVNKNTISHVITRRNWAHVE